MFIARLALLVGLAALTFARNAVWSDPVSLWTDSALKSPEKIRPHMNRGAAFSDSQRYEEAILEFVTVIRLAKREKQPTWDAQTNIAVIWKRLGHLEEARDLLEQVAVASDGGHPGALNALAGVYALTGRPQDALLLLDSLISLYPDYRQLASANVNRGLAFLALGDCLQTQQMFHNARRIDPSLTELPACEGE